MSFSSHANGGIAQLVEHRIPAAGTSTIERKLPKVKSSNLFALTFFLFLFCSPKRGACLSKTVKEK